jgi:hypothetical protein
MGSLLSFFFPLKLATKAKPPPCYKDGWQELVAAAGKPSIASVDAATAGVMGSG